MAFDHVKSGDRIAPTAFEWNALFDAGREAAAGKQGIGPPGTQPTGQLGWVKVKNVTGRSLRRYAGFRLGPGLWTLPVPDSAGATIPEVIYELSDNATPTNRPVVVLQQPLGLDAIGWAAASGVTLVKMQQTLSSDPPYVPINYMGISPGHNATVPDVDGAFVPNRNGGELQLLTPVIPVSGNVLGAGACYALAVFVERGIVSEHWVALDSTGSLGLSPIDGGIQLSPDVAADAHLRSLTSALDDSLTGWKAVSVGSGLPSAMQGWKCRRPGIWRITTAAYTKFTPAVSELSHARFSVRVSRFRSGVAANREHEVTAVAYPASSTQEESQCWVDYIEFRLDDILTIRTGGDARKITSFTASAALPQSTVSMRGNLTAELVTPHWSASDRTALFVPSGGGEE